MRRPLFAALRIALHVLVVALSALVLVRAVLDPAGPRWGQVLLVALLVGTYLAGGATVAPARRGRRAPLLLWLAAITLLWAVLVLLRPEAAYLVFPLFFLYLHLLRPVAGVLAVVVTTAVAILALGLAGTWSIGGVVGPLIGAAVALLIGLGYRAFAIESAERDRLLGELVDTRDQLAATEHEAGVLAERARLAREIHDTVAQGLSSIQMLLHAAERADPDGAGVEHVRLARETAASSLADTRRFIRELTPPQLDDQGLGGALRRLAAEDWSRRGLDVTVRVADGLDLPMHQQTALLRIAQGAVANVLQHAQAGRAGIDLRADGSALHLEISDDGRGFETAETAVTGAARSDSFGLRAIRERVAQLGGTMDVRSAPGEGTVLTVDLAREDRP